MVALRLLRILAHLNDKYVVLVTVLQAWQEQMEAELNFATEAENLDRVSGNVRKAGLSHCVFVPTASCVAASLVTRLQPLANTGAVHAEGKGRGGDRAVGRLVGKRAFCLEFVRGFKITDTEQVSNITREREKSEMVVRIRLGFWLDGIVSLRACVWGGGGGLDLMFGLLL